MRIRRLLPLFVALPVLGACSSELIESITNLEGRINTVKNCFPPLSDKIEDVMDLAELWKLSETPTGDPAGLEYSVVGQNTVLRVEYDLDDYTIDMDISFHGPSGDAEEIEFLGSASVSEQIAFAAAELQDLYPDEEDAKFILGSWEFSGAGDSVSGAGNLVGFVGDVGGEIALLELATTTDDTSAGVPPAAFSSISLKSDSRTCRLSFQTDSLVTDSVEGEDYPRGFMRIQVVGEETVSGSIAFDGSDTAVIDIDNLPGSFDWNIDDGTVRYNS